MSVENLIQGANVAGNVLSTVLTNRANKKLAEYQYTKDLEQWQRSNEYNLPSNQMKRLKDAGINPFMVYGGGSVSGNTVQSTTPQYHAPRLEAPQMNVNPMLGLTAIGKRQQIQQQQVVYDQTREVLEQTRLKNQLMRATMQAQIDNQYSNAKTAAERATWSAIKAKNDAINYSFNKSTYGVRAASLFQNYDSKAQDIMNKEFYRKIQDSKIRIEMQKLDNAGKLLPYQIQQLQLGSILRGQQDVLNQREMELQRYGTTSKDPWYIRMGSETLGRFKDWVKPKGRSW